MRYFKKLSPKIKVLLSNGQWLAFENVDNNWGIYPPEGKGISEMLGNEIRACIAAGRGGITEITPKEYQELVQKKNNGPLPKRWREEMAKPNMQDTATQSAPAVRPERREPVVGVDILRNPAPPPKKVPERPSASKPRRKAIS